MTSKNYSNLSVVIQGPVPNKETRDNLVKQIDALNELFPHSEIVLSTWSEQNIVTASFPCKVILEKDPGEFILDADDVRGFFRRKFIPLNKNTIRMLVSTLNGLRHSSGKIILKIRTDILIGNLNEIRLIIDGFLASPNESRGSFAVLDLYTRSPIKTGMLCHGSDILIIAQREDLLELFETSLKYLENGDKVPYLCPEQYLWSPYVLKNTHCKILGVFDFSAQIFLLWWKFLSKYVHIISSKSIELVFVKHQTGSNRAELCLRKIDFDQKKSLILVFVKYIITSIIIRIHYIKILFMKITARSA